VGEKLGSCDTLWGRNFRRKEQGDIPGGIRSEPLPVGKLGTTTAEKKQLKGRGAGFNEPRRRAFNGRKKEKSESESGRVLSAAIP